MDLELNGKTQGDSAAQPVALVGPQRNSRRPLSGAVIARPVSGEAEVRLKTALQRVVAVMVAKKLRGRQEGQK